MDAALVNGNQTRAQATFIEDSHGDLVDIEFYCIDCRDFFYEEALLWPAYDFSPDYDTCCSNCGITINQASAE